MLIYLLFDKTGYLYDVFTNCFCSGIENLINIFCLAKLIMRLNLHFLLQPDSEKEPRKLAFIIVCLPFIAKILWITFK